MNISIALDAGTETRLQELSKRTGKSLAVHLQELVNSGLDDLEDYYSAEDTMARIRNGQESTLSSEQVRKNLGLDD